VQVQGDPMDEYRLKASECLDLANRAYGGSSGSRFLAMAIMWLRLAEETERLKAIEVQTAGPGCPPARRIRQG
jgi:hypothetical protein